MKLSKEKRRAVERTIIETFRKFALTPLAPHMMSSGLDALRWDVEKNVIRAFETGDRLDCDGTWTISNRGKSRAELAQSGAKP